MYCIKCGVQLADTEKQCPLCGTRVFHPELEQAKASPLYPRKKYPIAQASPRAALVIVSAAFLLPMLITLLCDLQFNDRVTWCGYVIGALIMAYEMFVLPAWFKKPNPVIFVPCAFAALILYLLYINAATGGQWFLSFAFPVTGGITLIVTAVVVLMRYVPRGALYIFGGAFIALGVFMPVVEFLLDITFTAPKFIGWSMYPLVTFALLGGVLIFLAVNRPARETMERKFFI